MAGQLSQHPLKSRRRGRALLAASAAAVLLVMMVGSADSRPRRKKKKTQPKGGPVAVVKAKEGRAQWTKEGVTLLLAPETGRKTYVTGDQGYVHFTARTTNKSKQDRTISAHLLIRPRPKRRRPRGADRVNCLVYLESPAGSTRETRVSCKLKDGMGYWTLIIDKFWSFVP